MNDLMAERSILRARAAYAKHRTSRQKKSLKIIAFTEIPVHVSTNTSAQCKAINMSGKPCSNRAVCNGLCKRHTVVH